MPDRFYPANVMMTENPGSVETAIGKAKSENVSAATTWRENANGQLAPAIVGPTETQAANDLREVNNGKAAAASGTMPAGFTTPTRN